MIARRGVGGRSRTCGLARVIFWAYVVVSLVGTLGYIALALAGR